NRFAFGIRTWAVKGQVVPGLKGLKGGKWSSFRFSVKSEPNPLCDGAAGVRTYHWVAPTESSTSGLRSSKRSSELLGRLETFWFYGRFACCLLSLRDPDCVWATHCAPAERREPSGDVATSQTLH